MQPKGAAPVTRELDDISYTCPKCGAETKRTMKRGYCASANFGVVGFGPDFDLHRADARY